MQFVGNLDFFDYLKVFKTTKSYQISRFSKVNTMAASNQAV